MMECEVSLVCDSCNRQETVWVAYVPGLGFKPGKEWVSYSYMKFLQCGYCASATDLEYKKRYANKGWFGRFIDRRRTFSWFECAKGFDRKKVWD